MDINNIGVIPTPCPSVGDLDNDCNDALNTRSDNVLFGLSQAKMSSVSYGTSFYCDDKSSYTDKLSCIPNSDHHGETVHQENHKNKNSLDNCIETLDESVTSCVTSLIKRQFCHENIDDSEPDNFDNSKPNDLFSDNAKSSVKDCRDQNEK